MNILNIIIFTLLFGSLVLEILWFILHIRYVRIEQNRKLVEKRLTDQAWANRPKPLTRNARMFQNGGRHTKNEWKQLCKRYDYKCLACGECKPLTKDHIIPIVHGGSNNIDNLQPLCRSCNSRKHARTIDYRKCI